MSNTLYAERRGACPSCRLIGLVRDCNARVTLRYINLDHLDLASKNKIRISGIP